MAYISVQDQNRPNNGNGGDTTVEVTETPAVLGLQKGARSNTNQNFTFPAGAYHIEVRSVDLGGTILINGEEFGYNDVFHADVRTNMTTTPHTQDFPGSVEVIANGNFYKYRAVYPSTHTIDINTLP